jgi:putative component of membrane protein insertase Oxa1/YidC/SpoIIIJ protein YidD
VNEIPSQEEQEIARSYCCERTLQRPKTNIISAAVFAFVFVLCCSCSSATLFFLLHRLGVFSSESLLGTHVFASCGILFCLNVIAGVMLCAKRIVIGLVRLYQHYAPEEMRRKCLCKPTCSEYMIQAIKKYGLISGLRKSYVRLFYTCGGYLYRIDEP